MAGKALEDHNYELIKAHITDPDSSPLKEEDQDQFNRVLSIARVMDRYPIQRTAIKFHLEKYPEIKKRQAYYDYKLAVRLFNTIHTFDYDFWHQWLLNDIARNIERCREKDDPRYARVIAHEHANLIKALGEKPPEDIDPKLIEKHPIVIPIQINNTTYTIDLEKILKQSESVRGSLSDALFSEIDDKEADAIIES